MARGFSLIELLVAIAVLSIMLLMLAEMTGTVADTWARGESRIETYQSARAALELMTREMTPAVVDTRTQFVVMPVEELEKGGATNLAPETQVALWMAPLGEQGDLRCVGYYLYRDDMKRFYRLKRIYIKSAYDDSNDQRVDYFPLKQAVGDTRRAERDYSTSPSDAIMPTWPLHQDCASSQARISRASSCSCLRYSSSSTPWESPLPRISTRKAA